MIVNNNKKTVICQDSRSIRFYLKINGGTLWNNNNGILNCQIWQFIILKHSLSAGLD